MIRVHKTRNLKQLLIVIIIISMFFTASLSSVLAAEKPLGSKWKPLMIGSLLFYGFMPSWKVADILSDQKIGAAVYTFPSAVERLEAVAGGYLHASYAGLTASILLRSAGKDIVVLCSTNEKGRAIVANKDIKSLKDLVGKKVGATFGSIEHMSLIAEIANANINPKDVDIVNFQSAADMPTAMASGGIVAFCAYEPVATLGVTKYGGHILKYPYNSPMGAIDSGIETTREFIEKHPDLTYAIVKAHVQAVEYYNKNADEAIAAAVSRYKIPQDVALQVTKNVSLTYDLNLTNLKALANFLKEYGYIKKEPDWNNFVDDSFLKKAKEELGIK